MICDFRIEYFQIDFDNAMEDEKVATKDKESKQ